MERIVIFRTALHLSGCIAVIFLGGYNSMETQSTNNSGFKSRSASRTHMALLALCEGAIMVALAQGLSYLKLYEFPQGGSITIGMFPIFLYCARWGFGPGMLASVAYSLLQLFLDGAYAWGWQSMLGDYIIAFSVLGVAGLFYRKKGGFFLGTVAGCLARFLVHYLVGATIWASSMPESFFGMTMTSPWFYSALYNGSYMLIDMVLILFLGAILYNPMKKLMGPVK